MTISLCGVGAGQGLVLVWGLSLVPRRLGHLSPALQPSWLWGPTAAVPAHEPRGAEDHSLWHEALCLQWARRPGWQERGCAASSTSLSVYLTQTDIQLGRKTVTGRTLELCGSVTRWPHGGALAPFSESASTRNGGEVLASPGVGKKGSEVNRCQRRGVGRGGGVSPSGCYQEAQAGPKTEEEGTGPPKGPVLACDWGGGPGSQGGAAGKGLLPTRPKRGAGAQSPLPPSAGPASG